MSRQNRRGFSLTEATIAMVVLSVATAGVILPYSTGAAMNVEGARHTLGAKLAADLMEEIVDVGETNYNSVPIYDNIVEPAGSVRDADWNTYTDPVYSRYSRVSICTPLGVAGEGRWVVTVTIYYDNRVMARMSRLVGPG